MKYATYSVAAALVAAGLFGLAGCNEGQSGSTTPTASVVFSASLPSSGISKQMIDENTDVINIKLYSGSYGMDSHSAEYVEPMLVADVNVTRSNPTATISKVPVGNFFANITSFDANGAELDRLNLGGVIAEGTNNLVATMIRGKWTLDTPITLNKTLESDTARIDSVSIVPNAYMYNYSTKKAAFDYNSSLGWTVLPMVVNGANLPKVTYVGYNSNTDSSEYNVTSTSETRVEGYLAYFNQFKGLSTNTNAIQSGEIRLRPTSGTIIRDDLNNTREAFILGFDPAEESKMYPGGAEYNATFSENVAQYATSKVTAYNKMSGNIVEIRTKSQTWSEKCYDGNTTVTEINCPWNDEVGAQNARKKMVTKAVIAKKAKLSKSALNPTTQCFTDMSLTENERYIGMRWDSNTSTNKYYTVVGSGTWVGDACLHPFSATGSQLPKDDLNITIQKVR